MMRPLEVACPDCAQQPGEACASGFPFPPVSPTYGVHFERIEAANFLNQVASGQAGDPGDTPDPKHFESAVLATGDV